MLSPSIFLFFFLMGTACVRVTSLDCLHYRSHFCCTSHNCLTDAVVEGRIASWSLSLSWLSYVFWQENPILPFLGSSCHFSPPQCSEICVHVRLLSSTYLVQRPSMQGSPPRPFKTTELTKILNRSSSNQQTFTAVESLFSKARRTTIFVYYTKTKQHACSYVWSCSLSLAYSYFLL